MTRALALLLLASTALAAPLDAPEPEDLKRARVLYEQGSAAYNLNRYQDAVGRFEEAYVLSQRPALLYNIALCYEHLFRWEQAARALRHYLASDPQVPDRDELLRKAADFETYAKMSKAPLAPAAAAEAPPRWPRATGGAALALGVVAAGLTVGTAVAWRDLSTACATGGPGCGEGDRSLVRGLGIGADATWAAAAVAACITIVYYVWLRRR